jgi:hypothetical protein
MLACIVAMATGCGLEMGGLGADTPAVDAGGAETNATRTTGSTSADASAEAAPPSAASDAGDGSTDVVVAPLADSGKAPEAGTVAPDAGESNDDSGEGDPGPGGGSSSGGGGGDKGGPGQPHG